MEVKGKLNIPLVAQGYMLTSASLLGCTNAVATTSSENYCLQKPNKNLRHTCGQLQKKTIHLSEGRSQDALRQSLNANRNSSGSKIQDCIHVGE